ncbi:Cysteine proteinase inhibitor 5 [Linum grandiflorum]
MKLQIAVLTLLFAVGVVTAALGGWFEIKDLSDPDVTEAANFAVAQHNAESHTKLKLKSVDKAQYQVVNGKNYKLSLTVADDGKTNAISQYEAIVYVPAGKPVQKKLKSFNPKRKH